MIGHHIPCQSQFKIPRHAHLGSLGEALLTKLKRFGKPSNPLPWKQRCLEGALGPPTLLSMHVGICLPRGCSTPVVFLLVRGLVDPLVAHDKQPELSAAVMPSPTKSNKGSDAGSIAQAPKLARIYIYIYIHMYICTYLELCFDKTLRA